MTAARRRLTVVVTVALALVAAGCGAERSAASGDDVTIAFTLAQSSSDYYQTARLGALAAGDADGHATVVVQGPANPTATNMTSIAENLQISRGPEGYAANPCVLDAWTRLLNSLPERVPHGNVLAWNCKAVRSATESSSVRTYVGANDTQTAKEAVRGAVEAAGLGPGTTGTALVAECQRGVTILDSRQAGALEEVKRLLPRVDAVPLVTNALQGPNSTAWSSAFALHRDVVFAIGACGQDATSLTTLKERQIGGDFVIGMFDATGRQLQLIKEGRIAASVSTRPWVVANVATQLLIRGARTATPPPVGWIDTGSVVIDKSNVDQWITAETSPEAARAFLEPAADDIVNHLEAHTHPMTASFGEQPT